MKSIIYILIILLVGVAIFLFLQSRQFDLPSGETSKVEQKEAMSQKEILMTDGTKHSIPLDEILSGGPGKDGIPSIDNPKFISKEEGDKFLDDSDVGLGLTVNGESRFYPYRILVWHEIVNDEIQDNPILVTYCPLCATGIVFERTVDGKAQEFGVSGLLWQSNLLMYNRADNIENESLWSQVLGEAVLGVHTGKKLPIIRSDVVKWGDWKTSYPNTAVLSRETGASRNYGQDPYGNYYTSESVSFGATFNDNRLHPKALVHGIEIDGRYKAYHDDLLEKEGRVEDDFASKKVVATKKEGKVRFTADGEEISSIPGFWFSWLAVHEETELLK